jgi:hypothetical protein
MRKLIFVLLFIPYLIFSQSEREQKLSFRSGNNKTQTTKTESYDKTSVRTSEINRRQTRRTTTPIFYGQSYYDYNMNWGRWGAPLYGYSGFYPFYYYDMFGFRQPGRVYTYNDGKIDTIKGKRQHWRLGLSFNTENQIGGWITYGNKVFGIVEYTSYLTNDKSTFLPDLTMDYVILWNDDRLNDIFKGGSLYFGAGYKINKFGFYIMPGYGWDTNNFQFFDELYILSNNGKYSFPNYKENYFTGKFGIIYDYKYFTSKLDYNPFRNNINIGIGIVL